MFIPEKPASYRYNAEKGRSASIAFFVIMGYSRRRDYPNEAISVDELFSFSLLSLLVSVSSSSSATVNSDDSKALKTDGSLTQSKENTSSGGNNFQCFYSTVTNFVELNLQDLVQSVTFCRL
jgi:hypothetical protein